MKIVNMDVSRLHFLFIYFYIYLYFYHSLTILLLLLCNDFYFSTFRFCPYFYCYYIFAKRRSHNGRLAYFSYAINPLIIWAIRTSTTTYTPENTLIKIPNSILFIQTYGIFTNIKEN